ncbi:MAG TPA: sulfotransferase [Caulobacteraceae bacterium]
MSADAETEVRQLSAALASGDDPAVRERLVVVLAELGRAEEALAHLARVIENLPGRAKGWRAIAAALKAPLDPEAKARVWLGVLGLWISMGDGERADAFGADLAVRLFSFLAQMVQRLAPADPEGIDAAWRLVRSLYTDPAFAELALGHPERFADFVRVSGEDPYFKAAEKHGADLSPCVDDALDCFAPAPRRNGLLTRCRAEMAEAHGGLAQAMEMAGRLLADPEFHRPVVICGFHHSGTRLLARQLAALGVTQRINAYQYEWTYVIQLNSILQPGCMDPDRLGLRDPDPEIVSPARLAWRMALVGLQPGQTWGFKDPRNGLTARAWLKAFPQARIVHLLRDPVATLGTLPELYEQFVRLDEQRPTRVRFWMALWEAYVLAAQDAMAAAPAAIEIRFEDLCAAPEAVLGQVRAALGLKAEITSEILSEAPIDAGKGRVRERMRAEASLAEAALGPLEALARRYGYP